MGKSKERLEASEEPVVLRPAVVELFYSDMPGARERRELCEDLRAVFGGEQRDREKVHKELTDFINADENNERIILYLPFELLTNTDAEFVKAYKKAWFRLLFEVDVRPNFVDGDVFEPGLGTPAKVRKSAHLIPEMMQHGMLETQEVMAILEVCHKTDKDLVKSLAEGLMVARDRNLVTDEDFAGIKDLVGEMPESKKKEKLSDDLTIDELSVWLEKESKKIDEFYAPGSVKRKVWEKGVKRVEAAEIVAAVLVKKLDGVEDFCRQGEIFALAGVKGIMMAGEKDRAMAEKYLPLIEKMSRQENTEVIKNALTSCLFHWGMKKPDLSLPEPTADLEKIKEDPYLSKYVYPVLLVLGSAVKGYQQFGADTDLGIFIKPGTPKGEREEILKRFGDDPVEFWVEEEGEMASLHHFLFGGVWFGDGEVAAKLRTDLTEKYLDLSKLGDQKEDARRFLLRRMEKYELQYRLMHKGYRWLYPSRRKEGTEHASLIDWESDFWDEGYREVATLLFLSRVFLPDLSSK